MNFMSGSFFGTKLKQKSPTILDNQTSPSKPNSSPSNTQGQSVAEKYFNFIKRRSDSSTLTSASNTFKSQNTDNLDDKSDESFIFASIRKKQPNLDNLNFDLIKESQELLNKGKKRVVCDATNSNSEHEVIDLDIDQNSNSRQLTNLETNKRTKYELIKETSTQTTQSSVETCEESVQTEDTETDIETRKQKNMEFIDGLFKTAIEALDENLDSFLAQLDKLNFENASKITKISQQFSNTKLIQSKYHNRLTRLKDDSFASKLNLNSKESDLNKVDANVTDETKNDLVPDDKKNKEKEQQSNDNTNTLTQPNQITNSNPSSSSIQNEEIRNQIKCSNENKENQSGGHPAPLPSSSLLNGRLDSVASYKELPPAPLLHIDSEKRQFGTAVILTWEIPKYDANVHEKIKGYELFGYRENDVEIITSDVWKMIQTIPPYTPPVKCTLIDFMESSNYHFAIRIRDIHERLSNFSKPATIKL